MFLKAPRSKKQETSPENLREWVLNHTVVRGNDEYFFTEYFLSLCRKFGRDVAIEILIEHFPSRFHEGINEILEDLECET